MMLAVAPAMAAPPVAGGACDTSGQISTVADAAGTMNTLWCNGATWQNTSVKVGKTVSTCDAASEGTISYDTTGKAFTFCNGSSFVPFNSAAGTAVIKASMSAASFYPTPASCTAPACDSGYTSQGCTYGYATSLLNDTTLDLMVQGNMANRMVSPGFTGSCSRSAVVGVGLFSKIVCVRLCIAH